MLEVVVLLVAMVWWDREVLTMHHCRVMYLFPNVYPHSGWIKG